MLTSAIAAIAAAWLSAASKCAGQPKQSELPKPAMGILKPGKAANAKRKSHSHPLGITNAATTLPNPFEVN